MQFVHTNGEEDHNTERAMKYLPYWEMPTNVLLIAAVTYDCNQLYNGGSPSHTCMGTTRMGRYHDRRSPRLT